MSSHQYQRAGLNPPNTLTVQTKQTTGHEDVGRDSGLASSSSTSAPLRDDKQEPVVVRPYGAASSVPPPLPQHLSVAFADGPGKVQATLKTPIPSRVIAPAPPQAHLTVSHKVPGHITVTMESAMPQTSGIPVATISGQQGHTGNLHRIMATNLQIIRSGTPALLGSSATPQHQFPSHLPRGAAAAAVMSSSKGATVLRPASGPNPAAGQPTVQHIIHQPIQSRPIVTTSPPVLPTIVAPVAATRPQSPVISTVTAHAGELVPGRPAITIHPPPATLSIQRAAHARDTPLTRITLPSHPAISAQKPLPHSMPQKPIFSTVTPVAAATVAPILATSTLPLTTTTGSMTQSQVSNSNIMTVAMASHSTHAAAVTTSTIPVAKVVPQPITHTSPRIQSEFSGERGNLIPISAHRTSPNPAAALENRNDARQSVPMQFQYFLPTYQSASYPLTHTYTPITSSVSNIRPFPGTAPAPPATQPGMGVASAVHLNSMQLMTVDRITQINAQNMQPAAATQLAQNTAVTAQGLHTKASITPQSLQTAPINPQLNPSETKTSVVLADGSALVTNSMNSTFNANQAVATVTQTHSQGGGSGPPALVSSPRPSILRKKPAIDSTAVRKNLMTAHLGDSVRMDAAGSPRPAGLKPKNDLLIGLPSSVSAAVDSGQSRDPNVAPPPSQVPAQPGSALLTSVTPSSQPVTAAMAVTPPIPSMPNVVALPAHPAANSNAACDVSSALPEIKQEAVPTDASNPVATAPPSATPVMSVQPPADLLPGASPRKKPRKQQHVISTEESEMMETNSTDEDKPPAKAVSHRPDKRKSPPKEYIDEEGVRYVPVRIRPPVTLLRHYRNPWKAAYHHFQRYSDVRVKEKKGSVQDVSSQKGVVCRAQGWKIHLCAAQLLQLTNLEHDVYSRLTDLQEGLTPKKKASADDDLHRISELIQGNMQRCKLVMDQIGEARDAMMKVLDHRERVLELLNKNGSTKKLHKRKDRA